MKKTMIVMVAIGLMATILILSSCSTATSVSSSLPFTTGSTTVTTPTQQVTTSTIATTTTATTGSQSAATPTYGGSLTMFTRYSDHSPSGWDAPMTVDLSAAAIWANPFEEWLTRGDINTFGPRG